MDSNAEKRRKSWSVIESSFPPDSENSTTAVIGKSLLERARWEVGVSWRTEQPEVLVRFAELCQQEERRQAETLRILKGEYYVSWIAMQMAERMPCLKRRKPTRKARMKHDVMIDLETMGKGPNAAIIAIGACEFDERGITREFYQVVELESSVKMGLEIDPSTVLWWMKQSDEARAHIHTPNFPTQNIQQALEWFTDWLTVRSDSDVDKNVRLWGNGAAFDNVILANAYRKLGKVAPWEFWNDRCYRTVKNLFPDVKMNRSGTHHNAIDDAKSQALHLIEIFKQANSAFNNQRPKVFC